MSRHLAAAVAASAVLGLCGNAAAFEPPLGIFSSGALRFEAWATSSADADQFELEQSTSDTGAQISATISSGPVYAAGAMSVQIDGDSSTTTISLTGSGTADNAGGDPEAAVHVYVGTGGGYPSKLLLSIGQPVSWSIGGIADGASVEFTPFSDGAAIVDDRLTPGLYAIEIHAYLSLSGETPATASFEIDWTLELVAAPLPPLLGDFDFASLGFVGTAETSRCDVAVTIDDIASFGMPGDPGNVVIGVDFYHPARIVGIAWELELQTIGESWIGHAGLRLGTSDAWTSPPLIPGEGMGSDYGGKPLLLSSEGMIDLEVLGLDFTLLEDGVLRVEFLETVDDVPGGPDAVWLSGTLTVYYEDSCIDVGYGTSMVQPFAGGGISGGTSSGPVFASGSMVAELDGDETATRVSLSGDGLAGLGGDPAGWASVSLGTYGEFGGLQQIPLTVATDCWFTIADNSVDVDISLVPEPGGTGSISVDRITAGRYLLLFSTTLEVDADTPADAFVLDWVLDLDTFRSPDLNGDGVVNGADLGLLLIAWVSCTAPDCPEDLDGSGSVDGADLAHLLESWG